MALIKNSLGQISGKIGGNVFSSNRGGSYVRKWRKPTKVLNPKTSAVKAAMSIASQAWKSLSAGQRTVWEQWAVGHQVFNRIGETITLSGFQYFVRCYAGLLHCNPLASAPTNIDNSDVSQYDTIVVTDTAAALDIDLLNDVKDSEYCEIQIAVTNSETRKPVRYLTMEILAPETVKDSAITAAKVSAICGDLSAGQVLWVRTKAYRSDTGLPGISYYPQILVLG